MENLGFWIYLAWVCPILIYLFIWSVLLRIYYRKNNINSSDKSFNGIGESIIYACSVILGLAMFFILPIDLLKNPMKIL
jgi:hypothetical protein